MSPKMAAIVASILGEKWTDPPMGSISITSDGYAISGDCFIGSADDLMRNVQNLIIAAELTSEEKKEFWALYNGKVTDWRTGGNAYSGD